MLVTDARRARWTLPELVAEAVAGGVDAIYLRDVDLAADDMASLVRGPQERVDGGYGSEGTACRAPTGCRFLINGDPQTARVLGVGLHLRERDMSPATARAELGPDVLIGKSVHTAEGATLAAGADYILAGHVYPSASKPGRPPLGVAGFAAIAAAAPCPVLAIGGVTSERVQEVVQAGAHGVAVIGAIAEADDPKAAASALRTALAGAVQAHGKEPQMNDTPSLASPGTMVEIVVNGKTATVTAGATVHDFLVSKRMTDAMAIVERNGIIVPRAEYATTELQAGDRLEVVHAVGGG
jgi:thiamine-phosphate pyrophosphorylase